MAYTTTTTQQVYRVTNQPVSNNPFHELHGHWNVDLCDCCNDFSRCCYAYFCWCCFLGSLAGQINESKCSCWCVPGILGIYRMKVRSILKIKGDSCNDYCVTSCCPFCAALQMSNELDVRGIGKRHMVYKSNNSDAF